MSVKIPNVARVFFAVVLIGFGDTVPVTSATGGSPIISLGVPVYDSNEIYPPTRANNATYYDMALCARPCYVALDLSSSGSLGNVWVVWYSIANGYDHTISGGVGYNLPSTYTLDANTASGGALPTTGWVTLASVTGEHHNAHDFALNLTGYHWLRMNVTGVDGLTGNNDVAFELDVSTQNDGWFFAGDSITSDAMTQDESYQGTETTNQPNFMEQVNAAFPSRFPIQIDAGIGGITATVVAGTYTLAGAPCANCTDLMKGWMSQFPGQYVTLNYGTNDVGEPTTDYYTAMADLVQDVLAAGKTPIVPTIPWSCAKNVSPYNQQIQTLYTSYPQIVHGPDLYSLWLNSTLISGNDCIHPSYPTGMATYRRQWAQWAIGAIYGVAPAVTLTPSSLSFAAQPVGTTSGSQAVTLTNSGTAALTINSIGLADANASDFGRTTTCPLSPATLAVNASCTISVSFTPSASGARSASVQITDNAGGSPQSVAVSGTASTIAFDQNLGTQITNGNSTTMRLTTSASAGPNTRVFAFVAWTSANRSLHSVSGGGLTWTIDNQVKNAANYHVAIASASAQSGLASGVTITATFTGSINHGEMAAASFSGIATTSSVDAVGENTQSGTGAWTAIVTTSNPNDLVLGWSVIDAITTSTPTPPNIQIHDFSNANFHTSVASEYQIETTAGAKTVSGTWASAAGATGNATVVVAYKAA